MTKLSFASLAMTGVTVTALALACCSSVPEANAFTASPPQHPLLVSVCNPLSQQRSRSIVVDTTTTTTSRLYAKKPAKKNKKKPSAAAAAAATTTSSSGGGFGKARVESTTTKVRTVSGHAGSGEKPLRQAANNFDAIFKEHGKDAIHDVYCYSPLDVGVDDDDNNNNNADTFWFVGKIAIKPGVSPRDGVLSQKRLILEYSKRELRPQNLGGKYARALELWLAPGDSEMDAVQNKVDFAKVDGTTKDLPQDFSVRDVGYNPEIYVGDEVTKGGLRVKRDPSTGKPIKAVFEVNQSM